MLALVVIVAQPCSLLGAIAPRLPERFVHVPNRQFWLAPERRTATLAAAPAPASGRGGDGRAACLRAAWFVAGQRGAAAAPQQAPLVALMALYSVALFAGTGLVLTRFCPRTLRATAQRSCADLHHHRSSTRETTKVRIHPERVGIVGPSTGGISRSAAGEFSGSCGASSPGADDVVLLEERSRRARRAREPLAERARRCARAMVAARKRRSSAGAMDSRTRSTRATTS